MSSNLPSIEDKRIWIEENLNKMFLSKDKSDLLALDLEISFLLCAAQSYKHETVLKPFPSTFLSDSNNNKNHTDLLKALESLPPVTEWLTKVKHFNKEQLSLVYWLLVHKNYKLEYCPSMNQEKLKELAKYTENFSKPSQVFEIKYSEEKNRKFESLINQTAENLNTTNNTNTNTSITSTCFHGTRMDNIYSILHMGLLSHFSKNALFGEGTYLSQEPSISLHYSPSNKTWNKSLIGQRMSCLLVCEIINDPNYVKTGFNESSQTSDTNSSESAAINSISRSNVLTKNNSKVPEKYYVVRNNDYVRVKYILLYSERTKIKRKNKLAQILNENKFLLLLITYSLLLLFIGLMNSRAFHSYIKLSYRKLSSYLLGEASTSYD